MKMKKDSGAPIFAMKQASLDLWGKETRRVFLEYHSLMDIVNREKTTLKHEKRRAKKRTE